MQIIKELYFKNYKYVFVSYCNNIQSLFKELNKDDDLDLVGLLKENERGDNSCKLIPQSSHARL